VALSRRAALRRRRSMAGRHSIQIAGAVGGLTATTAEDAPAAAPLISRRLLAATTSSSVSISAMVGR
jgi:hypothetical protein